MNRICRMCALAIFGMFIGMSLFALIQPTNDSSLENVRVEGLFEIPLRVMPGGPQTLAYSNFLKLSNGVLLTHDEANALERERRKVFVEDGEGNLNGFYSLQKREDGKYDVDIWTTDSEARIEVKGLLESPKGLRVRIDSTTDDPTLGYIVYMDSVEIDYAIITLPRDSSVSEILFSEAFDPILFSCDEWESTEIPFSEGRTTVTFEVDHFSAYATLRGPTTYILTTTADSGEGSLREAIQRANDNPGIDTIEFNIPAEDRGHYYYQDDGIEGQVTLRNRITTTTEDDSMIPDIDQDYPHTWWSIKLESALPTITDPIIIDGYTQKDAIVNSLTLGTDAILTIELSSENGAWFPGGLHISAGESTVRGLVIQGFELCGIQIDTNGGNAIQGNYIGTDVSGTHDLGNFIGVNIYDSSNNFIGGEEFTSANIISGSELLGVFITGEGAIDNMVVGNYLGTDGMCQLDLNNDISDVWVADNVLTENIVQGNFKIGDLDRDVAHQIIFVDPSVADFNSLVDYLLSDGDSNIEVVMLESNHDGIEQITEILTQHSDITGIHIVSHGFKGTVMLGNTCVHAGNIYDYFYQLRDWRDHLTESADILIYGCNVGEGQDGMDFIDNLNVLTNADIAASDDPTGSSRLGGDWDLEVTTGIIETEVPFTTSVIADYDHLLSEFIFYDDFVTLSEYETDPRILSFIKNILINGLGVLATRLGEISSASNYTNEFLAAIPCLLDLSGSDPVAPGLASILGGVGLGSVFQENFADEISDNFIPGVSKTADDLKQFIIDNIGGLVGLMTLSVWDVDYSMVNTSGSEYELTFDVSLKVEQTNTYKFDIGRNSDLVGLAYDPEHMPNVQLESAFTFDYTFGTILTLTVGDYDGDGDDPDLKVEAVNDDFFIDDTSLAANANVSESGTLDINSGGHNYLHIGFLEIEVEGGSYNLDADTEVEFEDPEAPEPITLEDLEDYSADDFIGDPNSTGSFSVDLPVVRVTDIGATGFASAFSGLTFDISMGGDPFDGSILPDGTDPRTAPQIDLSSDFKDYLLVFKNITPDGVLGLLEQLKGWLGTFTASQLFSLVGIPFADGETLANVLGFSSGLDSLITHDDFTNTTEDGVTTPKFADAQDLAQAFADALSMTLIGIDPSYDRDKDELTYTISIDHTIDFDPDEVGDQDLEAPIDFNLDLGPLGSIESNISVTLSSSVDFTFTIGIDLSIEREIGINSALSDFGLRALIEPTSGTTYTDSPTLTRNAEFKLTIGGLGGVEVLVPASDTEELGFTNGQNDTGTLTATGLLPDPVPGKDVCFTLTVDTDTYLVKLDKLATDDNGISISEMVSDINDALQEAINEEDYDEDITSLVEAGDNGGGKLIFTALAGGSTPLQIDSIGTTEDNGSLDDLAGDIENAINDELDDENIDAEVQVEIITGDRISILTTDTVFMKIQDNSEDNTDPDRGFLKLGFLDEQLGTTSPLPRNGVLSGTANFGLTIGTNPEETVTITQDLARREAVASAPDPIDQLIIDIQSAIDTAVGGSNVEVKRLGEGTGDGFVLILESSTDEFIRVNEPNDIAMDELGLKDEVVSAEVSILGVRILEIEAPNKLTTNGVLDDDADITLQVDGETVSFSVHAANGKLIGFECNQSATGIWTAENDVTDPSPGKDITFKLTIDEDDYIISLPKSLTNNNGTSISSLVGDMNIAFADVEAEDGSPDDITGLVTAGNDGDKITITPTDESTFLRVSSMGDTQDNTALSDLANDVNEALARERLSDGTRLDKVVVAGLRGYDTNDDDENDEFYMVLSIPSALKNTMKITDVSGELGFEITPIKTVSGPRVLGQLTADATFTLTYQEGTSDPEGFGVVIAAADTSGNDSIKDLVEVINVALENVTPYGSGPPDISDMVVAGLLGNKITFSATSEDAKMLRVTSTNWNAREQLGLTNGVTAVAREASGRLFIRDASLNGSVDLIVSTTEDPAASANFGFVGIEVDTIQGTYSAGDVALQGAASLTIGGIKSTFDLEDFELSEDAEFDLAFDEELPTGVVLEAGDTEGFTTIGELVVQLQLAIDSYIGGGKVTVGDDGNRLTLSTSNGLRLRISGISEDNTAETELGFANGQQTGRINLSDLMEAVPDADLLDALVNFSFSGGGKLELTDINLTLHDAVDGLIDELTGTPKIEIILTDLLDLSTIDINTDGLGAIADGFDDLNFEDVFAAIQELLNTLLDFVDFNFLDEPLPLVGITINELLGYIEQFSQAIDEFNNNPASMVQDLERLIKEALGLPEDSDTVALSIETSSKILRIDLGFDRRYNGTMPIDIDLVNLLGISMPGDIVNLSGAADLEAEFSAEIGFGIGIDLDDPSIWYIYDNTGIRLEGYALGDNVNFTASLGPFGLFITGGKAVFNEDGDTTNTNPASFILAAFDDPDPMTEGDKILIGDIDLDVDLYAGVGAVLPCYFPTASTFIGNLDFFVNFDIDGNATATLNSAPDFENILPDISEFSLIESLQLAVEGLDMLLAFLETLLGDDVLGSLDLPLIGDELEDAVGFIEDIRSNVIPELREFVDSAPQKAISLVQEAIFNSLGPGGLDLLELDEDWHDDGVLDHQDVQYNYPASEDMLQFNLWLRGQYSYETPEIDFGLPGLGLDMDGGIEIILDWDFLLGFGISKEDGFYFDASPWDAFTVSDQDDTQLFSSPEPVFDINLGIVLPNSIEGQLLFLELEMVNLDGSNKSLEGWFDIDIEDADTNERRSFSEIPSIKFDFGWCVQADIDLDLTLGVAGGDAFPHIVSGFEMNWGLEDGIDSEHPSTPIISFTDVGLNLGSYFSEFLAPILEDIQEITEPIQPIVDVLTTPIPVISDLAGEDITLIDIAGLFGTVNPAFIEAVADLITFINSIPTDGSDIVITFGSFSVGGDGGIDLTDSGALSEIRSAPSSDALTDHLDGDLFEDLIQTLSDFNFSGFLDTALGGSSASGSTQSFMRNYTQSVDPDDYGWQFPIFSDPGQLFGLLLGRNADIIKYDMPPLIFEFTYSQYFPIWDGLGAEITGTLGVIIDLSFGYDTEGIRAFAEGGFRHPLDLFKGFYIGDLNSEGVDIPEVTLYGSLTGAAVLNLVVAKVGVGGGIFVTIDFNLNDPDKDGKIRIEELLGNVWNGLKQLGPIGFICIFDVSGKVEARLFAFVELLFGLWEKTWYFGPSLPLLEFEYSCPKDPVLATVDGDELRLNMGDFAEDRLYKNTTDGNESFTVTHKSGNTVEVSATLGGNSYGPQEYSGVSKIVADCGAGNDTVDLSGVTNANIIAELRGESGDDILIAGDGIATIYGGEGNDVCVGGPATDTLYGEKGNDTLIGNGEADVLDAADGDDVLDGGDGDDILLGYEGDDMMAGGNGEDVIRGGDDKDQIWGDSSFQFNSDYSLSMTGDDPNLTSGSDNPDHITGDADPDLIYGEGGEDIISGGGEWDEIHGGDGSDKIWCDSDFKFEDNVLQFNSPDPVTIFPLFGTAGGDLVYGGDGVDYIYGEDGNDEIYGEGGNDEIYGDRGADILYGNDNDDILYGGMGNDRMYGNHHNDEVYGGIDNDAMFGDDGEVTIVPAQETVNYDLIWTTNPLTAYGDDTLNGGEGDDVIMGGPNDTGNDIVNGGVGDDIMFGDNGEVDLEFQTGIKASLRDFIQSIDLDVGGEDYLHGEEGDDIAIGGKDNDVLYGDFSSPTEDDGKDVLIGDNGEVELIPDEAAMKSDIKHIKTTDTVVTTGGDDEAYGSGNEDVIMGGVKEDDLVGDLEKDILIGDSGEIDYDTGDGDLSTLDLIRTTDVILGVDGGVDHISGGEKDDIAFGGDEGDFMYGDDSLSGDPVAEPGSDILVGDQGEVVFENNIITRIESTDTADSDGGIDEIEGNELDDIIIGGVHGDLLWGDTENDILVGDEARLTFNLPSGGGGDDDPDTLDLIETIEPTLGDADTIEGNDGDDIAFGGEAGDDIFGNDGDDKIVGDNGKVIQPGEIIEQVYTTDPDMGGSDTIEGNDGSDLILGGAYGDTIEGNDELDVILGDNGYLDFVVEPDPSTLDLIMTTDPDIGGSDDIWGNLGNDTILGGAFGDTIEGNSGEDIILGDNGMITQPGEVIELIETTDPTIGGIDMIWGKYDADIILGGAYGDFLYGDPGMDIILGDNGNLDYVVLAIDGVPDPSTLDLIIVTDPNDGGSDYISCGSENDIAFGGTDSDEIYGNEHNDLLFGDHAKVERPIGLLIDLMTLPVPTFTFTAIFTAATDGGDGDLIHGNTGEDILLGQQGDDDMFGDEDDDDLIGGHNVVGGIDELDDPPGLNDMMDGGSEDDVLAGDNAIILRRTDTISPRIRALNGTTLYDDDGNADVDPVPQGNPSGARGRNITLLDHSDAPTPDTYGNDYMAGGSHEDVMFGQLGDDLMQGDASVAETISDVDPSVEGVDDGDDYMEGSGGQDLMYGNLGQDDMVGGSSELFGLTSSSLRPDDSDLIFGGAGIRIGRNHFGDLTADGHAKDADFTLGDNGDIFRIVGENGVSSGAFLIFTYDNYSSMKIIPRAIQLLDYTPGGDPNDIGEDDFIHGEAGDDLIHGMTENDVLFGEGQDDDIFGGTGHDRIYGGTHEDGILGDDGKLRVSRNGETEPLHGVDEAFKQKKIKMPGPFIGAWINIKDRLKKVANLEAFESGGNDILYGGLGDDWMHGGAGDDGMLGAEALATFYNQNPITNTTPLPYDPVTRKISYYDAENPRVKISGFFLNFDATDGMGNKINDGKDRMFGDNGHDWIVGGTQNDRHFGGLGDDVINADDNHDSQGGLNNQPDDPEFADCDFTYGGAGLDVMIFNTGGDRSFDWVGEFNSYIAPYAPFGEPETDRLISPHVVKFLMNLGEACGADQALIESDGELGLADQKDPRWGDQMGGPRDPQAGNLPGVHRDTMGGPEDDR